MHEFKKLEEQAADYAAVKQAFDNAYREAGDLVAAIGKRLEMERNLAASRAAELRKTANDTSRSATVRRVAEAELKKIQAQKISATPEESKAFTELIDQQHAALRDLKKIQQAAKPEFEAATKRIQAIRAEILGSQWPALAPNWMKSQSAAFEKLSAGGGYNE